MLHLVSLVINEVMYDPLGAESSAGLYNEAVEIYNEDTLNEVCLDGWRLGDTYDLDPLEVFPDSTILEVCPGCVLSTCVPPGGFAVVLDRDYTNPSSPVPTPYTFPSGTVVMSVSDASIGNGLSQGDSLFLVSAEGDTVDAVGGFPETGDGRSAERRSPLINEFLPSRSPSGHTLGYGNSVSCPYSFSVNLESTLRLASEYEVSFTVKNTGIEAARFVGRVLWNGERYSDYDTLLPPDSTARISLRLPLNLVGTNEVSLSLDTTDCDTSDNFAVAHFVAGRPSLVINEINYKGVEWVEIHNAGDWDIILVGARIKDASSFSDSIRAHIRAGGFLVITGDSTFTQHFPTVEPLIASMPRLNDTYDVVAIVEGSEMLDSLTYRSSWGGGENISLERISPFLPSTDSSNWGTCRDPMGGTPGAPNSLSTSVPEEGIKLPAEIFRTGEAIPLAFAYPFKVDHLSAIIYDDFGRMVRRYEFAPRSTVGQVLLDTEGLWRGLYFLHVVVEGEGRSVKRRIRFALK